MSVHPVARRRFGRLLGAGLSLALAATLGACAQPEPPTEPSAEPSAEPTYRGGPLRESAAASGRFFGFAANARLLCDNTADCQAGSDETYRQLAATQFSQITPENAMKWESTEPYDGDYTFTQADGIVAFAAANNQTVHGHTLLWHSQTPDWVANLDAEAMRAAIADHIATVAGRYADNPVLTSWDVVNEAIDDSGQLRETIFLKTLGEGYIADAFRFARQADPDADLCLNDYGIEGAGRKSDRLYELVKSLLADGVPITCVGFQGHLIVGQVPTDMVANLQRFADLGLKLRITELDIRIPLPVSEAELEQQAADFAFVVDACLAVEACQGITTWGIDDGHSWLPNACCGNAAEALLWDPAYRLKPAYAAVDRALLKAGTPG